MGQNKKQDKDCCPKLSGLTRVAAGGAGAIGSGSGECFINKMESVLLSV